ncbi:MAG: ECF transporter S component [Firmicutes bacterium]|nr:ECF transporter S component [Bacillota bacterium]
MLKTRQLVVAGLLAAVTIVLGMSGLGLIPVPTPAGRATIMHVPVILAGVLEGPLVGAMVGFIFGLYSISTAGVPFLLDPVIAILPRILIGILSAYVFKITHKASLAAVAGTICNTAGVLGLAVLKGYLPWEAALGVAVLHGLPEVVVAAVLAYLLVRIIRRYYNFAP